MGRKADILDGLGGATPVLRRFARALCAGATPAVADELVQNALHSVGTRIRNKELRPSDLAEARIEAYAVLAALAAERLGSGAKAAPRHPPIVHGLADLEFDERAALLLVSLEGFGYDAAARIIGVARETLVSRLMRARSVLGAPLADGASRRASHLRVVK